MRKAWTHTLSQRQTAEAEYPPPQRQGAVLAVSGRQAGLPKLSVPSTVPEAGGQTGRPEAGAQLFHAPAQEKPGAAYPAGVPGGAEAAADLVRGLFCHPEALPQFNTAFAAGTRGSGGPLPPFRHGLEPQKIDTKRRLTP